MDQHLIDSVMTLTSAVRLGEGIIDEARGAFTEQLRRSAAGWSAAGGLVPTGIAGILVELYPAVAGAIGLYSGEQSEHIAHLAESLLDEILTALHQ